MLHVRGWTTAGTTRTDVGGCAGELNRRVMDCCIFITIAFESIVMDRLVTALPTCPLVAPPLLNPLFSAPAFHSAGRL